MNCVCAGITILLALSVYQMIVNEKLPATSDAVPLLGKELVNLQVWLRDFTRKAQFAYSE